MILVAGLLAGCSDPAASQHPSGSDKDRVGAHVDDLNAAYEKLRVGGNACDLTDAPAVVATCFDQAYTSSGVDSVLSSFDQELRRIESHLDSGDCRSAIEHLDSTLVALRKAVATTKRDVDTGNPNRLINDGQTIQNDWKASVRGMAQTQNPC